jgi:hypothetical protein
MTPEQLLRINLEKASAKEILLLIALAVEDVIKAKEGKLTSHKGEKIIPDMNNWALSKNGVCHACLAGCFLASRFDTADLFRQDSYFSNNRIAHFLNNCRFLPMESFSETLFFQERNIKLPTGKGSYLPSSSNDVVEYLQELLRINSGLLIGDVVETSVVQNVSVGV